MESIAIIGIGCRFPGAKNTESFWQLLRNGVDAISEMPKERWDIDRFYDPEPGKPGKISTRWGGFLEQVDGFDASFFGISPREVERTDPQQRLVLDNVQVAISVTASQPARFRLRKETNGIFEEKIAVHNPAFQAKLRTAKWELSYCDPSRNTSPVERRKLFCV